MNESSKMDKKEAAKVFRRIAVLLELAGENPFKSRAYENGARVVESYDGDLVELAATASDGKVKGIGKALAEKLTLLAKDGELPFLTELESSFPDGVLEMMKIQGLGPKKVKRLVDELDLSTLGELEYACQENRLIDLPGFGAKSQQNILQGIDNLKKYAGRYRFPTAYMQAQALMDRLAKSGRAVRLELCGSLRRGRETVKDIDLLATATDTEALMVLFVADEQVERIVAHGPSKSSVVFASGIASDLRVVPAESFATARIHFTGSAEHNTQLRGLAKKKKLKLNEYGLYRKDVSLPAKTEKDIYRHLGLNFIVPELREGRGEVEAAAKSALPDLIETKQVRGVVHVHTNFSDGSESPERMARECQERGFAYLAITDHSQTAVYAGGLPPERITEQRALIDAWNAGNPDFRLFAGIESDILTNGELDYPDDVLATLDLVIASVHGGFRTSRSEMTDRVIRAVENPFTRILGHPTGRLLLGRKGYELDMEKVLDACAANGVAVELNANPYRLDIDWRQIRKALSRGVKISINPDAHSIKQIDYIDIGVRMARKGWCEPDDVVNTRDAAGFERFLKEGR